ncbi:hypothetical protein CPB83DRAFT_853198 [Crepidotus variabilis]|uniref:Uncharacterized protein n=1 Tax=Crepidotus variabilis TaxID=179855 RepID=A0A9P6JR16_9AGAR|nr:hypothetical protein CPB83DRAFT_853198 [Crepidotus variabilis]
MDVHDDQGGIGNEFRFDHFRYTPSPNADLENRAILIQDDDPDVRYGSGWQDAPSYVSTMTNQPGSFFDHELEFTGTAVSVFSILPKEFFEKNLMPGSYSIDGGFSTPFNQTGHPNEVVTQFNQKMFKTPTFVPSRHKLTVTYLEVAKQIPCIPII